MKVKVTLFLLSAAVILLAAPDTLVAGEEMKKLEWQWTEGDKLIYNVKAELSARKPHKIDGEIEAAIHVTGRRPDMAEFRFHYTKNRITDETGTSETPADALENASKIRGYFDTYGRITDIDDKTLRANIGRYIAAWFPPLRGNAKRGETWDVNIPGGQGLSGTVYFAALHNNSIAVLEFSYTVGRGKDLTRKITGTARFDIVRGRYISVRRTITKRGKLKVKTGSGLNAETTTVEVDQVRTAECVLVSSPDDPHPRIREREWIESLKKRLDKNPADVGALLELGSYYLKKNKVEEAKKYLLKALAITDNLKTRISLGQIYLNEGDLDSAEKHFKAVLKKKPESGPARLGMGHVYFKRGDHGKAAETAETVLKENPESSGAYYLLGLASGKIEAANPNPDFTKATLAIRKYIELDVTLDQDKKRKIQFTSDGALKVLVEAAGSYRFTETQLAYGRQLVRKVLAEAAERLNIGDSELVKILDFLAGLVEKKSEVLIDDFIKDRKKTGAEIGQAFAKYTKPDPALIAKAVRGKWDPIPYIAASTFQPPPQALEMLLTYTDKMKADKSVEERGEIYLYIAAAYLKDAAGKREKLDRYLEDARRLLKNNPLPGFLSAHLALLDKYVSGKAGGGSMDDYLTRAFRRVEYSEFRSEILSARKALLEQIKFPEATPPGAPEGWQKTILLSTAASWQPEPISDALRVFMTNLLSLSRSLHEGTNSMKKLSPEKRARLCVKFADQGRIVTQILKKRSDMVELSLEARSFEEEFLKTLVKTYENRGDVRNAKTRQVQYSDLHREQKPYFDAVERYSRERDRALGVMPLTEPAQAAARAAEIIAGERQAFERAVEEWLNQRKIEREKLEQSGPLGPATGNPFGPDLPRRGKQ